MALLFPSQVLDHTQTEVKEGQRMFHLCMEVMWHPQMVLLSQTFENFSATIISKLSLFLLFTFCLLDCCTATTDLIPFCWSIERSNLLWQSLYCNRGQRDCAAWLHLHHFQSDCVITPISWVSSPSHYIHWSTKERLLNVETHARVCPPWSPMKRFQPATNNQGNDDIGASI